MLFGEHAVLHGGTAVVAAINRYVQVTLTPRADERVLIKTVFGKRQFANLQELKAAVLDDYILAGIAVNLPLIRLGFELAVSTDLPIGVGLGSSTAVLVATLGVINWWLLSRRPSQLTLHRQAMAALKKIKKNSSGADIAASLAGGVVEYRGNPCTIKKIAPTLPLITLYSGNKLATSVVVKIVNEKARRFPAVIDQLYDLISNSAKLVANRLRKGALLEVGELMDVSYGFQKALGVDSPALDKLVTILKETPGILGAKISGAGLGDCVIGLGKASNNKAFLEKIRTEGLLKPLAVKVSSVGIVYLKRTVNE